MNRILEFFEPELYALKYGTCKGRKASLTKQEERLFKRFLIGSTVLLAIAYVVGCYAS